MKLIRAIFSLRPQFKTLATSKLLIEKPAKLVTSSTVKLPFADKKKKRVGRGLLSTAGRGRKGYKHRHGKDRIYRGYEGGQSTFVKKMPKIGLQSRKQKSTPRPLYLDTLEQWIKLGRIDASKPIKITDICKSKVAGKIKDGVVLLAKVQLLIGR